jgi:hypothetical protein
VLDPAYARAHVELGSAYASKAEYLSGQEAVLIVGAHMRMPRFRFLVTP